MHALVASVYLGGFKSYLTGNVVSSPHIRVYDQVSIPSYLSVLRYVEVFFYLLYFEFGFEIAQAKLTCLTHAKYAYER